MATVAQDPSREDQPFTMNPPTMHMYNAAQQIPVGVYPNGDGPFPSVRQRRSQKLNPESSISTTPYAPPVYDRHSPQSALTDHRPVQSSQQQPPTQQPSPPQSFKDPSPTHINQSSDDKTPEPADPVSRFSNQETPAPHRQPSQLYGSWQSTKSYGQEPPPSRGSMRSVSQQPGFQSPGNFGGYSSQQTPDNPPTTTRPSIPLPLSSNPRAVPQSPRYINAPPNGTQNPIYAKPHVPKEEVCLECAMRDQDMADVDVTSPGTWERGSDVYYQDLVRSEEEAISNGIPLPEDRPRSTGDMLTETNLKLWLTMNPREPASRHMNLETYVRAQRLLLEAETIAHARAMQESKQLENKMRDTYSQLRRSAYELGAFNSSPGAITLDETGRMRSATLPGSHQRARSHSRDVTLLENGLIVEHVNVKKEEREEREKRKREERRERSRARKSSRGSGHDLSSVYGSFHPPQLPTSTSGGAPAEHNLRASRYSQSSLRPTSVLSSSMGERSPTLPRAYSTTSFSDLHSIAGSASPNRRTRFFSNLRTLSPGGWRSRDSLAASGVSGSMMDMHVALQQEDMNEQARLQYRTSMPNRTYPNTSTSTPRAGPTPWPQHSNPHPRNVSSPTPEEKRKKKKGLAKIWSIVTGSVPEPKLEHSHPKSADPKATGGNQVYGIADDDYPLAPPPPLSYLVDRDGGGNRTRRHSSTPCLPGTIGQQPGQPHPQSPNQQGSIFQAQQQGYNGTPTSPTVPSSVLPSPTSPRMSPATGDALVLVATGASEQENDLQQQQLMGERNFIPPSNSSVSSPRSISPLPQRPHTVVLGRDKNLPPLPPNESSGVGFPSISDIAGPSRPQTMYATLDGPRHVAPTMATVSENLNGMSGDPSLFNSQIAFRSDGRRQSFGGMEKPRVLVPNPYDTPRGARQNGSPSYGYPHANGNGGSFNAYNTYHVNGNGVTGDAYGEFGNSRASLGWWDDTQKTQPPKSQSQSHRGRMSSVETTGTGVRSKTPSKRKSRFGLTGMFGKKKDEMSGGEDGEGDSMMYSMPSSEVHQFQYGDGRTSGVGAARMSVASRKAVQHLVEQDPEFVAYRYPSSDVLQR
ncbi:hypothetical protein BDM02DRAFT_2717585 [Thelephora ganbajun]|uniref:Uncharacterized protein n=1 Tax=Thelephora ganbajun TaxID=370292 RepID=A0ACB6ZCM8_THEGA|nr:hypothetical protein BDM02DRAFT_2717585 [Thelephora ganbajun]